MQIKNFKGNTALMALLKPLTASVQKPEQAGVNLTVSPKSQEKPSLKDFIFELFP